jgi:putative aldouronate transport system substrate-binding protein
MNPGGVIMRSFSASRIVCIALALMAGLGALAGLAACSPSPATGVSTSASQQTTVAPTATPSATIGTTTATSTLEIAPTDITWIYPGFLTTPFELQMVEDEINQISRKQIHVRVVMLPIDASAYGERISQMMAARADMDLLLTPPEGPRQFNAMAAANQLIDLTDRVETHGLGAIRAIAGVNPGLLAGTRYQGHLYGLPVLKDHSSAVYIALRQDVLDRYGLDLTTVHRAEDLTAILSELARNETIPALGTSAGGALLVSPAVSLRLDDFAQSAMLETFGNPQFGLGAVLGADNDQVVNYFASEAYRTLINQARSWYEAGYIYKDAAAYRGEAYELVAGGAALGFFHTGDYSSIQRLKWQCGHEMAVQKIADCAISTSQIQRSVWVLPQHGSKPDAVLDFLALTYENEQITNWLEFGIQDRHYIEKDGLVFLPPGVTQQSVGYAVVDKDLLGNPYLAKTRWTDAIGQYAAIFAANKASAISRLAGFNADSTRLGLEVMNVRNVLAQYRPGFECGKIDPAVYLPEFLNTLAKAGYPAILAEMQRQVDNFRQTSR